MTMRCAQAIFLFLFLAACAQRDGDAGLSAAEQTKAAALLQAYETAGRGGNWEAAETHANRLRDRYPDSEAASGLSSTLAGVRKKAGAMRDARRLAGLWEYQAVALANGVQRSAAIYSQTVPADEGEVLPTPDARLVFRNHPEWGRSAYLLLAQARFRCGKPCAVQIRFDDGDAQAFAGKQADSGKGPALFIEEEKRFIQAIERSRIVRIEFPQGSGRLAAVAFEVAGYQASRYETAEVMPAR